MTMFEAQALEFPFVERLPKREKGKLGKLWDHFKEASAITEREGMMVPVSAAAKLLGVSRQRAYDLVDQGTLRTVEFAGQRYVTENSIIEYCQTERKAGRPVSIPGNNKEVLKRAIDAGRETWSERRAKRQAR
jgi:hypothetical protein